MLALAGPAGAADPPSAWKFDVLRHKNGSVFRGLVIDDTPSHVRFQIVRRQPGRATAVFTTLLARSEIDRLDRLSDADRQTLRERLDEIDAAKEGEQTRMESLELHPAPWAGKPAGALRYDSDHFSLVSDAPEDVVRRAAVRLEQIYAAYARYLPPRHKGGAPTTVMLYASADEYQRLLDGQGWKFQNPAFFDPPRNRIVVRVSGLQRLGDDLERVRQQHRQHRAELRRQEADLRRLYAKKPDELARHLRSVTAMRRRLAEADRRNDAVFEKAAKRLFAVLYHEAFHAYVNAFVYPPAAKGASDSAPGELPRWLNEGLAQVFETALVEAGELRLGHANRERLGRARELLRKGNLPPMKELLRSTAKEFMVAHDGDRTDSDRAYLASWAVGHFLTFDRRLLGTPALDEYVKVLNAGEEPGAAFAQLVGQPLDHFEKDFHKFLERLQPDGSLTGQRK